MKLEINKYKIKIKIKNDQKYEIILWIKNK